MRKSDQVAHRPWEQASFGFTPVPMELLIQDVYASSGPDVQKQMLAQLVGKVYETAPIALRARLLEHLDIWPETELGLADVQIVGYGDVVAVVEYALQVSSEALNGLTQLLLSTPELTDSGAGAVLMGILLQQGQFRRASDRLASPPPRMYTA